MLMPQLKVIGDIVEFVETKARIANHPVFGSIHGKDERNKALTTAFEKNQEHQRSTKVLHSPFKGVLVKVCLRKWILNSREVFQVVPTSERGDIDKNLILKTSLLNVPWYKVGCSFRQLLLQNYCGGPTTNEEGDSVCHKFDL